MEVKVLMASFVFLTGCIVQNTAYFSSITPSEDKDYGYTSKKPVEIKNGPLENSINSSYYFLSRLRTNNGGSLRIVDRASVINPNYKSTGLVNRHTGRPIGGGGMLLDRYVIVPVSSTLDTIIIYINPYKVGEVKTPKGLKFEKE